MFKLAAYVHAYTEMHLAIVWAYTFHMLMESRRSNKVLHLLLFNLGVISPTTT